MRLADRLSLSTAHPTCLRTRASEAAPATRRLPLRWATEAAKALAIAAALAGCGDSGKGGAIDLGEPQAGADDTVATAACALLEGSPTEVAGAANGADAPLLEVGEAYLVEPVPAGTAFVRFDIPAGMFRGGLFVRPSESLLSARLGAEDADLSAPKPNGHCAAENLSDYRLASEAGGSLTLELDGDAPLWMVLIEGGSSADGG